MPGILLGKGEKPMAEETTEQVQPAPEVTEDAPIELLPDPTKKADLAKKEEDKPDPKAESALAYQLRKERERSKQLEEDNNKYKRREEDDRKAKLTAEQKRDEELSAYREKAERLERENLITKIGIDARLPQSMWGRIQGADEDAMRADAAELAALVKRPAVGSATDPVRDGQGKARIYTRSELQRDPKLAASAEVAQAAKEGRVVAG